MVRERSAKPLCVGSIPTRASNLSMLYRLVVLASSADVVGIVVATCRKALLNCSPRGSFEFCNLLLDVELFQTFHCVSLVLLRRMSVAEHHLNP